MFIICFTLCSALVLWSCSLRLPNQPFRIPAADFILLVVLAALPFIEFLLGRLATHAMEARYALGCIIAISALVSIALGPLLRKRVGGPVLLVLIFSAVALRGFWDIRSQRQEYRAEESSMVMTPEIRAAIMASPSGLLYTQDIQLFGFLAFHDPDATTVAHPALVYSHEDAGNALQWQRRQCSSQLKPQIVHFTTSYRMPALREHRNRARRTYLRVERGRLELD